MACCGGLCESRAYARELRQPPRSSPAAPSPMLAVSADLGGRREWFVLCGFVLGRPGPNSGAAARLSRVLLRVADIFIENALIRVPLDSLSRSVRAWGVFSASISRSVSLTLSPCDRGTFVRIPTFTPTSTPEPSKMSTSKWPRRSRLSPPQSQVRLTCSFRALMREKATKGSSLPAVVLGHYSSFDCAASG